jgi:deazaflavin-dependent oxidoreductase (nitroreductase family)
MDMSTQHPRIGRPRGALRLLLRVPIALYRMHLGWLLGRRFLLLTHRGRRSGRTYQTAIEVVRYDAARMEATVVSGWGAEADWVRNIRVTRALAVQVGTKRYVRPEQTFLDVEERDALLRWYWREHRVAARAIAWLFRWPSPDHSAEWWALMGSIVVVTFQLQQSR